MGESSLLPRALGPDRPSCRMNSSQLKRKIKNLKLPLPSPPHFPQSVRFREAWGKGEEKKKKKKKKKTLGIFGGFSPQPLSTHTPSGSSWRRAPGVPCAQDLLLDRDTGQPARVGSEVSTPELPPFESPHAPHRQRLWAPPLTPRGALVLRRASTKRGAMDALRAAAWKAIRAQATQALRVRAAVDRCALVPGAAAPSAGPRGPGSPGSLPPRCLTWGCCCSSRRRSGRRPPWSPGPG